MKATRSILVAVLTLMLVTAATAQVYRVDVPLFTGPVTFLRATTVDSTIDVSLKCNSNQAEYAGIKGAWPDSVYLIYSASGPGTGTSKDSVTCMFTIFSKSVNGLYTTRTLIDSLNARANTFKVIDQTYWRGKDFFGVYLAAYDGTTATQTANASATKTKALQAWVVAKLGLFYHK